MYTLSTQYADTTDVRKHGEYTSLPAAKRAANRCTRFGGNVVATIALNGREILRGTRARKQARGVFELGRTTWTTTGA